MENLPALQNVYSLRQKHNETWKRVHLHQGKFQCSSRRAAFFGIRAAGVA
jgi:hypothetical protein